MIDYNRSIVNNHQIAPNQTLIKGATILSMDENIGNIECGEILITDSTITAVGHFRR